MSPDVDEQADEPPLTEGARDLIARVGDVALLLTVGAYPDEIAIVRSTASVMRRAPGVREVRYFRVEELGDRARLRLDAMSPYDAQVVSAATPVDVELAELHEWIPEPFSARPDELATDLVAAIGASSAPRVMLLPVFTDDGFQGLFVAYRTSDREIPIEELDIHATFAALAGAAIGRHRSVTTAQVRDALFRSVLEVIDDALIVVDAAGRVEALSGPATTLLGTTIEEGDAAEHAFAALVDTDGNAFRDSERLRGVLAGASDDVVRASRLVDGRPVHLELRTRVFSRRTDEGRAPLVVHARDVTHHVEANRALLRSRDAAVASVRGIAARLSAMSDELRTPMHGILAIVERLLATGLTARQQEHAVALQSAGDTLLGLLNDLVDLSHIESGRLTLEDEPLVVADVVVTAAELVAESAYRRGLDLVLEISPRLPAVMRGDAGRVRQVLQSLLTSAIRHTTRGHIVVRARPGPRDDGAILFEVEDTGAGLAPDRLAGLRAELTIEEGAAPDPRALGLSVVGAMVRLMGGRAEVTSVVGGGTTFSVEIPLKREQGPAPVPAARADDVVVFHPVAAVGAILAGALEGEGFHVEPASTVDEVVAALGRAGRSGRRIVIVERDAHDELARSVIARAVLADAGCHVVSMTRWPEPGARLVLRKPVRARALAEALAGQAVVKDVEAARRAFAFRVLVVDDEAVNRRLAAHLLEQLGCEVLIAEDGVHALERIEREPVEVVLMDLNMPGLDGREVTRRVRAWESADPARGRRTILACSASPLVRERERLLDDGFDDILPKPVDQIQLTLLLEAAVRASARSAVGDTPDAPIALDHITKLLDVGRGAVMLSELVDLFRVESARRLAVVRAAAPEHANELAAAARGLGDSAAALGARRVSALCTRIEGQRSVDEATLAHLEREVERAIAALQAIVTEARAAPR